MPANNVNIPTIIQFISQIVYGCQKSHFVL